MSIICNQCQGEGKMITPGVVPSSTTGLAGNAVDGNPSRGNWPLGTIPVPCTQCKGNGLQNSFGGAGY